MADYQRAIQRFYYEGVSLLPEDALPPNKVSYALNVRSYEPGTLGPRYGLIRQIDNGPLPGAVNSLFRLNDTTLFADVTAPQRRFGGAGTVVFEVAPGDNTAVTVDTGYSGNPLTGVVMAPINSARPYLYIGDSARTRKFDGYLNDFSIGLPAPSAPPSAVLQAINTTFLEDINGIGWAAYGSAAAAPTVQSRVNTIITQLIYDSGAAGFASVSLSSMVNVTAGSRLLIDAEPIIVQDILPAVASTTIAAILYDVGTNGPCSIQPVGSFSQGQLEIPLPDEVRRRYEDLGLPAPARITVSRPVDFPVNSLIQLGGGEVVQIQSVAIGADGTMSFRATTAGTFAAGNAIVGIPCFRADLESAHAIGAPVVANCQETIVTPPTGDPFVAGIQSGITAGPRNWAIITGPTNQASTPSDIIALCVRVSQMVYTRYVRLQLNLGSNTPVYEKNYFFYEWRANDLFSAIQTAIGNSTALISEAQTGAVEQGQQDAAFRPGFGQETAIRPRGVAPPPGPASDGTGGRGTAPSEIEQRLQATDGFVTVGSAPSRQLALGNDQWLTLQCRVGDLTRVGTDSTLTLASITDCAIVAQFDEADPAAPITFQVSDAYLTGGYGPDVGATRPPYVYRYRYRSTITGEYGNPSPSMRAGVRPHRGSVLLTGVTSAETQCDIIDWFRFGGALARWAYVGSSPNASPTLLDTREDRQIDGGETLRVDHYQIWPSYDLPRMGTCNIAGTSVERVSGDVFDLRWAPDSGIIINGRATSLYRSPSSSSRLEVIDNVGSGTGVTFSLPSPTLLAQPLPYIWGGPIGNVSFLFACGDIADPGRILWSHGNDPDSSSDRNTLVVTSASEPLMNGFFYDGVPYVFSSNRLYRIIPTFGQISDFRSEETPCTKGLWSPWAFCVIPEGVCFLAKDGIYFTQAGGEAQPLTDPDFSLLFPQDGVQQSADVRTIGAIDFSRINQLKLTYVDSLLYFDYYDEDADGHTLVYNFETKAWTPDRYRSDVGARIGEPGPQVETHVIGTESGFLYQFDGAALDDAGVSFNWAINTPHVNGGDARTLKQFGDTVVDGVPGGGYTATPVINNGTTALAATVVPNGIVRNTQIVELVAGDGTLSQNLGLRITGVSASGDPARALLYYWEPAFIPKAESIARRATDWEDLGYKGAKFIQGVIIRANTFGAQKAVQIQFEGGHVGVSLTLLHDGETQYAYPVQPDTWTPFVAELVRLIGVDANPWTLLDWRWVWEPAPEAATLWATQPTTFDQPGFIAMTDVVLAYQAFCPVTLRVYHQDSFEDYEFPASTVVGDQVLYRREYQRCIAAKGKWIRYDAFSDAPFRLFKRDCAIRVQAWGNPSGYLVTTPFGGPSRADGAAI